MIEITSLPALNAALNSLSAVLLLTGYRFIRAGNRSAHRASMLAACASSTLFLISYLVYHFHVGSVAFKGQGLIRPIYFTILISHTILATAVVPLAIITLLRGLQENFIKHRRIARWTFPIWMYVFRHRRNRLLDALLVGSIALIAHLAAVVFRAGSAVQMSDIT